eukprot:TRINITY_DN1575_c0_g1_i1.p1 TRINITY_DN1575_c0_g1~~TRINITY_DN1575_c0_g1_i1.p1  ORF type:complete len:603 (-),score=29.35 TRINITY_DN1575_c0_g1_i1:2251-3954(-)
MHVKRKNDIKKLNLCIGSLSMNPNLISSACNSPNISLTSEEISNRISFNIAKKGFLSPRAPSSNSFGKTQPCIIRAAKYILRKADTRFPEIPGTYRESDLENFLESLYLNKTLKSEYESEKALHEFIKPKKVTLITPKAIVDAQLQELINQANVESLEKYYEKMVKSHLHAPSALYGLALFQLLANKVKEAIAAADSAVRLLVERNDITLLPYAIQLRAIGKFTLKEFSDVIKDYSFYVLLQKVGHCTDPYMLYTDFGYPLEQARYKSNNITTQRFIKIRELLRLKQNSVSLAKTLFQRKSSHTINIVRLSDKRNSSSNDPKIKKGEPQQQNCVEQQPIPRKHKEKHEKVFAPYIVPPRNNGVKIRFVSKREREAIKLERLSQKVEKLRDELEENYFQSGLKLLRDFSSPDTLRSNKELVLQNDSKTLTLRHISALKKEFAFDKSDRDYTFLKKSLARFSVFSKLNSSIILQNARIIQLSPGSTVYKEGSEGNIIKLHKVKQLPRYMWYSEARQDIKYGDTIWVTKKYGYHLRLTVTLLAGTLMKALNLQEELLALQEYSQNKQIGL